MGYRVLGGLGRVGVPGLLILLLNEGLQRMPASPCIYHRRASRRLQPGNTQHAAKPTQRGTNNSHTPQAAPAGALPRPAGSHRWHA